jgi:16S rRNA (guanine966-N2)-methyltransferase
MSRLRVIAGRYGGRTIRALAGDTTRPTTDRVREAWASTVTSLLPEGFARARVLDAFAGSGALGLEALSRGALHVTFCERDRRALDVLRANCDLLDSGHAATAVLAADTFAPPTLRLLSGQGPYDLVILDPPYACAASRVTAFLSTLAKAGALSDGALITYERQRPASPAPERAGRDGSGRRAGSGGEGDGPEENGRGDENVGSDERDGALFCARGFPAGFQMVSCKTYGLTQMEYFRYQ